VGGLVMEGGEASWGGSAWHVLTIMCATMFGPVELPSLLMGMTSTSCDGYETWGRRME
jgi:hypothetical protein